jgi:hypothetical protein
MGGAYPTPDATLWVTTEEIPDMNFIAIDIPGGEVFCYDDVRVGYLPATAP